MSRREIFRLRVSAEELGEWRAMASRAGLTVSAYLRRCVKEAIALQRAVDRADAAAAARVRRLGELSPVEIDRLRRRGGDIAHWPELDEQAEA